MGRYSPPAYVTDRSGELLAEALNQASSGFFGGIERGRERRHQREVEQRQRDDAMLGLELSHPGLHRPGAPVPNGQGAALAASLPNSPLVEDEYSGDQGPTGMPSDLGFGRSLADAIPTPPLKPTHSGRGTPPWAAAPPVQAGAPAPTPPTGHPGAFDPTTGAFRDGKGVPKIGSQPVAAPAAAAPRVRQLTGGWTMNDDEADAAAMHPKELERAFAERDRARKVQSIMKAYQIPQDKAEALVDNPGLADNALYPTAGRAPATPRRQLVRTASGAYVSVDPETGLGPDGKPVQGYTAPQRSAAPRAAKPTEGQMKFALVYPNAATALEQVQKFVGDDGTISLPSSLIGKLTFGGYGLTPEQQSFQQASEILLSAILRPETGAAVSDEEWKKYSKQYIPLAGDAPETVQQKLQQIALRLETMKDLAGPALQDVMNRRPPGRTTGGSAGEDHTAVSDEDFARAWKAGIHDDAAIAEWVKKNPVKKKP